jgi:hypothetical protein
MSASFQSPNLAQPFQGSAAIAMVLDFTATSSVAVDLAQDMEVGKLDFIQTVYVDNADNSAAIDLIFGGVPGSGTFRIRVQGQYQGWFPIFIPKGPVRMIAQSNSGAKIAVFFANIAMPYFVNGPTPGISVVPPLVTQPLDTFALVAATPRQLVAGVALQTVKLFRGIFEVDGPCTLKFQDGNGGPTLFSAFLTTGGSIAMQVSGVPWFNTSAGNGLFVVSSANVNLYGGFSYVQS